MSDDMKLYVGHSVHKFDSKGRVVIPARFRKVIERRSDEPAVYVWPNYEGETPFLDCYDNATFMARKDSLNSGLVERIELEPKQGRIALPKWMRVYARLSELAVVVAADDSEHFEIWSAPVWQKYNSEQHRAISDRLESVIQEQIASAGESSDNVSLNQQ